MRLSLAVVKRANTSKWRGHALVGCIVALGLLLAGASWLASTSSKERNAAEGWREHTREVLDTTNSIKIASLNLVRGQRGFLLTGDREFLEPFEDARPIALGKTAELAALVAHNPHQLEHTRRLRSQLIEFIHSLESVISAKRLGQEITALDQVRLNENRKSIEALLASLGTIAMHEEKALAARTAISLQKAKVSENYQYFLSSVGFALIVLSLLAIKALRNAQYIERKMRDELRQLAMTDELTGLVNRRELLASLERSIAAAGRSGRPLAFAILDIDHFKRVNDQFGHPAGDAVIRTVAINAVDEMRGQDTVGRLGGEEFGIVLPDCDIDNAYAACERLRLAIQSASLEIETGHAISVTISTGLATFKRGDHPAEMIARADAALYRAKADGRDKVLLAA